MLAVAIWTMNIIQGIQTLVSSEQFESREGPARHDIEYMLGA